MRNNRVYMPVDAVNNREDFQLYYADGDVFLTVLKNVLVVVALPGAVADIDLPEVYDGFLVCSDGSTLPVTGSKLTVSLGTDTSAQGILKLVNDN